MSCIDFLARSWSNNNNEVTSHFKTSDMFNLFSIIGMIPNVTKAVLDRLPNLLNTVFVTE